MMIPWRLIDRAILPDPDVQKKKIAGITWPDLDDFLMRISRVLALS
jgi:hypothetical protein